MKRIISAIVFILVMAALVAMNKTRSSKVSLKCSYMAYACGDCQSQYRVDSVLHADRDLSEIVGKDISIFFENNGTMTPLEEKVESCWICYDYFVEGVLQEHWLRSKKELIIDKHHLVLRNPDCCPARERQSKITHIKYEAKISHSRFNGPCISFSIL